MDLQENNSKNRWKNRELIASLEFAVTGLFTA
ncbi:TPA: UDP kinase, partial [Streptococcus suis]